jgi:glucose-1-phosphate thymidylyltransferase
MAKKGIILRESENVKKLYPLTYTRAAFMINIGGYTLYDLIKEYFPGIKVGFEVRKEVEAIVLRKYSNERMEEPVVIDACSVPSISNMRKIAALLEGNVEKLDSVRYPHDAIIWHKRICKENIEFMAEKRKYVLVHENVVLNAENGPIIIDDGSVVMPFSYIEGPVYIGKNTKIVNHASIKSNVVILDTCKIGGEVEESVVMSYTNKQHYGFLGNSYVCEWVNIGAGSTTSDLKNTYGTIAVIDGSLSKVETGEQFLGSVIGDYSKLAINTSVFTGKVIGVNSMIYGFVDRDIPSFVNFISLLKGKDEEFHIEKAVETQKRMFERRKVEQKKEDMDLLKSVFEITKKERERFISKK